MTGLIYAAIIAMWAIVLVPMWLRGHDRSSESRSIDRFEGAMKTLRRGAARARRTSREPQAAMAGTGEAPTGSTRSESTPERSTRPAASAPLVSPSLNPSPSTTVRVEAVDSESLPDDRRMGSAQARLRAAASARQRAAGRRRVVLISLGAVLVVVAGLVAAHRLVPMALLVPVVLLTGYVVIARRQVRLADQSRRRLERSLALGTEARSSSSRRSSSKRSAKATRARTSRIQAHLDSLGEDAPIEMDELEFDPDAWEAVPTTLPTYVTAPRATRVPRVIDLTTQGSWNGQAMVDQAYGVEAAVPQANSAIYDQIDDGVWDERPGGESRPAQSSFADRYVEDAVEFDIDEEIDTRFVRRAVND